MIANVSDQAMTLCHFSAKSKPFSPLNFSMKIHILIYSPAVTNLEENYSLFFNQNKRLKKIQFRWDIKNSIRSLDSKSFVYPQRSRIPRAEQHACGRRLRVYDVKCYTKVDGRPGDVLGGVVFVLAKNVESTGSLKSKE